MIENDDTKYKIFINNLKKLKESYIVGNGQKKYNINYILIFFLILVLICISVFLIFKYGNIKDTDIK